MDYIISNKTITLTCYKIKYCVIWDVCYQFMGGNSEKEKIFKSEVNIIPFNRY